MSINDLLAGALLLPRTCPHWGRPPDDFADEETVVEDRLREALGADLGSFPRARRGALPQNLYMPLDRLQLVDALESEALDVFRLARRLERGTWTDPDKLARHGRSEVVQRLRAKFASEHVDLASVDTLDEQLDPLPAHWYRQGGLLLDCAAFFLWSLPEFSCSLLE